MIYDDHQLACVADASSVTSGPNRLRCWPMVRNIGATTSAPAGVKQQYEHSYSSRVAGCEGHCVFMVI